MELNQEYQETSNEQDLSILKDEIIKLPERLRNFYAPIFNLCMESKQSEFLKELRLIIDKLEPSFVPSDLLQEKEREIKRQEFMHLKAAINVAALIKEDLSLYLLCREIARPKANYISQKFPWNQLQTELANLIKKYPMVLEHKGISKDLIVRSFQMVYQKLLNLYNQLLSVKNDNLQLQQTVNSYLTYYDLDGSLVDRLQDQTRTDAIDQISIIYGQQSDILKNKLNQLTSVLKEKTRENEILADRNMMLKLKVERLESENTQLKDNSDGKEKKITALEAKVENISALNRKLSRENARLVNQNARNAKVSFNPSPKRPNQLLDRHLSQIKDFVGQALACDENIQQINDMINTTMADLKLKINSIGVGAGMDKKKFPSN